MPKRLGFPMIVKSLTQEASIGISQASVVDDEQKMRERVQFIHDSIHTDALVEQYIEGRELYSGVIGNERLEVFPLWEMTFANMPEHQHRIATERVKWSPKYQQRMGIELAPNHKSAYDYEMFTKNSARATWRGDQPDGD